MFVLYSIKDSVRIAPSKLSLNFYEAIKEELNVKFCNKIVPGTGLAISVFDLDTVGDPLVHPGDGSATVSVVFRLIVFRPVPGEIVCDRVRSSDEYSGIKVSLGFFDDIIVPPGLMPEGTRWDPQERVWIWSFEGSDFFIDPEEQIRVRVMSEVFVESAPTPKEIMMAAAMASSHQTQSEAPFNLPPPTPPPSLQQNPPYRLIASIAEDGLGLASWWQG